jgi:hypothetical protein
MKSTAEHEAAEQIDARVLPAIKGAEAGLRDLE